MAAKKVSWDHKALGYPVASIDVIKVDDEGRADEEFKRFNDWLDQEEIKLVSCRLPHDEMRTIMFLENQRFKFIEMVLHPIIHIIESKPSGNRDLVVDAVGPHEIDLVASMAESAFGYERYHIDPRVNSSSADVRYGSWVKSVPYQKSQILVKISDHEDILGFFIIERVSDDVFYWHLTALNPEFTGKGLGMGVWSAVLLYCKELGAKSIQTTISARNSAVLNIYSRLSSRFGPPEVTLHWVRDD